MKKIHSNVDSFLGLSQFCVFLFFSVFAVVCLFPQTSHRLDRQTKELSGAGLERDRIEAEETSENHAKMDRG